MRATARRLSAAMAGLRADLMLREFREQHSEVLDLEALSFLEKYDPDQPRHPEGSPEGGQWSGEGGGGTTPDPRQQEFPLSGGTAIRRYSVADFDRLKQEFTGNTSIWNDRIGMSPTAFRSEFGRGLIGTRDGDVEIRSPDFSRGLTYKGQLRDSEGSWLGSFTRRLFTNGEREAHSDYLSLPSGRQGGGLAREFLRGNVDVYKALGINRVDVHANIDVGGYAWAKYGYVPTQSSWNSLRQDIERNISTERADDRRAIERILGDNNPRRIWDVADIPKLGKTALLNTSWYGSLHLNDREVMDRFDRYIATKKK